MKKTLAIISFCLFTIVACKEKTTLTTATVDSNETFETMLKDYYEDGLKLNPVSATMSGDNRYNEQYPNPLSQDHIDAMKNYYNSYKEKIASYDSSNLTDSQKMSLDILKWECDINLEHLSYKNHQYFPIDQMWTANLTFGQLASGAGAQPFNTVDDYKNWQLRVDGYLQWLAMAENNMREGVKTGYVLPASLIKKIIPQLNEMTVTDVKKHLFYSPVYTIPESFSNEEKETITIEYTNMIADKVIPTYESIHDFMENEYLEAGRKSSGIDAIPNGEAYYNHQIKLYTTTNMTADEIHNLGLKEVARILSEMEQVKNQIGFEGDIKAFFNDVRSNPKLMPFKTPEEVIANFNAIHETMKPQLEKLFDAKPKTPFEVRRTEAFRENSASAEYNPGSLDGTRPGIFYTPIPDATKYNVYSDESLFLHEAIPGHHYQISLTQESKTLSDFRKTLWYSGYGEGWALYSESLGKELGLYTDPYQYFGMLGAEMHRAIRLVVDTGMHAKGWSREKAIQYSLENEAEPEAGIISEIERYMANPGQALSYKIGQLKIQELRAKAKAEMGDKFDIRQFHNQVLETGCVPLALLEEKINSWITATK
ncbi:hypothetical protein ULMS_13310 [Patiriisocius marinistellae]|uniref:DUF885 domain-containing protein n=1 Tax=Patiriisocius marinistellae TaxID=2494560 RepID=A0A5J4FVA5_9FLAO|nr:DUF885 domain-containing protein [Patiriisocius marinistellae]GEQ85823.1 hypothetical protein ULMS_13310 [Patiriisocius marinistellae]